MCIVKQYGETKIISYQDEQINLQIVLVDLDNFHALINRIVLKTPFYNKSGYLCLKLKFKDLNNEIVGQYPGHFKNQLRNDMCSIAEQDLWLTHADLF